MTGPSLRKLQRFIGDRSDEQLWDLYGLIHLKLKKRRIARTKNLTAERAETAAISHYRGTHDHQRLVRAPPGKPFVDALSRRGRRYSIKAISVGHNTTGTFQGDDFSKKRFDFLVIVFLDQLYRPIEILEASWTLVNKHKRYHRTMKAYNLSVTNAFRQKCRVIYERKSEKVLHLQGGIAAVPRVQAPR